MDEVQLLNLSTLSSATNHNGGAIHFGTDGRLYIAAGVNATPANAQSLTTTLGKLLRINADGSIPGISTPVNDTTYTALLQPAVATTVFADDFEAARGWTLTSGANTASTGSWQRGDPQPTSSNGTALQLGTCNGGSVNCFITGLSAGNSAGTNDIDGGRTSIQSPAIALPATGTLTLTFRYYLAHLNNATSADDFRVRVVGANGTPQTVFTRLGGASVLAAVWTTQSVDVSAFAGQTVRLRIEAADAGTASLVEAGVDDVVIRRQ
jgi:aminopeptidase S